MGVPVAQKSDSWVTVLAMTDSGGLGVRPINGGRGSAVEQRGLGLGENGPPVSPPERVSTPPAPRLAAWWRMSSPGPLRCSTPR
jgi:1-phosphatidylinositol-3-phosphate 5-kinase